MTRLALITCVVVIITGIADVKAGRQNECDTPLAEGDLRQLIDAGVAPVRIRQMVLTCGIDVGHSDVAALEARIRQLGAPAIVVAALFPPDSPARGASWTSPIDRRRMTFVSGGRFDMGSPADEPGRDADETQHNVVIAGAFWIDVTEVTNAAYRRFVLSRPEWQKGAVSAEMADARYLESWDGNAVPAGAEEQPVVSISWHAARAFAAWAGKRLPSEAEWEYAARADTKTAYWWGDGFDETKARGTNPWGLAAISGGAWEWTASLFRPYPFAADGRDDPRGVGRRSIRGGASANGASFLRIANRNSVEPAATSATVGFRCVQ